jgi:hypothetical protein
MHRQRTTGALFSHSLASNIVNCGTIYTNPRCPDNSGRSLLTPASHSKPPIPIIENQGFFRLPNPKKQHNQEIVTPLVCAPIQSSGRNYSLQKVGSYSNLLNIKNSGRKVSAQSPQVTRPESPHFVPIDSKENKHTITELKCQLSNKEIEILDLRNEKMRLEILIEEQQKSSQEKAKELECVKKQRQSNDEYGKLQRVLKVQQETHDDTLAKLKEKVCCIVMLIVCEG